MKLRNLLAIHAFITLAAGIKLIVEPERIPKIVGISVDQSAYLLCYLLGAAELALAFLSFHSSKLTDGKSLRLICSTFILFHAATAAVEILAFAQGTSAKIWANIALRVLIVFLFWYYGIRKPATQAAAD